MDTETETFAGVELGGTKVVCGLGRADGSLLGHRRIATGDPDETLPEIRRAFSDLAARYGAPRALGIATFGPVRLDPAADDYGVIGPTPKRAWRGVDLGAELGATLGWPFEIQTDVIGAAIGETAWGAGMGLDPFVYITVGTGIGGGVIAHGRPVTGLLHPEIGHMRAPRAEGDDHPGGCTAHGDCIEGMAAGPSVVARWGSRFDELGTGHAAHGVIAHYLGHLVANVVLCTAPRRVVLGGGVMSNRALFPLVREKVRRLLAGFLAVEEIGRGIDDFIVPPGLGGDSGLLGAIRLATLRATKEGSEGRRAAKAE